MNLLSGLEKFGLEQLDTEHLFEDEKKAKAEEKKEAEHTEVDFLLLKKTECPVCDRTFQARVVKTGRARRMQPDFDLRPRFAYIDTNKYDVLSCPYCGYTAVSRYFQRLMPVQVKMINAAVRSRFKSDSPPKEELVPYTYEEAIERYKLALYCTIVKKGHASEKAYECLKLSWLYRGVAEELTAEETDGKEAAEEAMEKETAEAVEAAQKQELLYYGQAYEGFMKAIASESFPMCGMEENTMNLLLACMAYKLGKREVASKLVSRMLTTRGISHTIKDRAMDLKDMILADLRKN